jgi:hypothetical protein
MARVVKTVGPRGYRPKYGVTETGEVIELYPGEWIKETGGGDTFNHDFLNVKDTDVPYVLSGKNPYTGKTDAERIAWLTEEMRKMQLVATAYAGKIKELAKDEPDLSAVVSTSLVLVGGKILKAAPIPGAILAGAGLIIKWMSTSGQTQRLAAKKERILEWAGTITILQDQYAKYAKEIQSIQNKKYIKMGLIAAIFAVLYYY